MSSKLEKLNAEIISCRKCPRLVEWREEVARVKRKAYMDQEYWGKPVPGFGDPSARVLVVGLAPGAHGSNRTGRQFTGDASGGFLFPALHRAGFANQARAESRGDGLVLKDMYITASGRCAPPDNKPSLEELNNCQPFLEREIEIIKPKVIVALGRVAFERVLRIYNRKSPTLAPYAHLPWRAVPGSADVVNQKPAPAFSHGAVYELMIDHWLLASYHPSQQNTLTGKLTVKMFDAIWKNVKELIDEVT
ncbi:MAG TPA: uracil-DNA glycosylase [Anaerolineales bacterium]|nr:uracil-DNA glycosylase [Anaerolineales bacterium]